MKALIKTRSVLTRVGPDVDEMGVPFSRLPEAGEQFDSTTVFVWPDTWSELGEPDTITVTIEPGDHLNQTGDEG